MICFKQFFQYLTSISLVLLVTTTNVFGVMTESSNASILSSLNPPSNQIAWDWGQRAEAVSKDIEGKTQEAMGNMTGDPKDQLMGKAKQVESNIINTTEDIKDSVSLEGRAKAVAKNVEGKAQETMGNITGNSQDQFMGKAKQVESQARNIIEDIKGN